jgi:cytochrome c peroxidase
MRKLLLLLLCLGSSRAADLTLAFEPRWAGQPIAIPSAELKNDHGQPLTLTRWSALISSVALTSADGTTTRLTGQYGAIDAANAVLAVRLRNVPPGDYRGLAFEFGLPVAVNHADPGRWPADHPLNPLVDHLHWNWQGGYVFLALEGHWHAGGGGADDADRGFSYHIAGDSHVMPVRFAANFQVAGDTTIRLAVELGKVLRAQRFATDDGSDSTHSAANDALADRVAATFARSFFWLGAEPCRRADVTAIATTSEVARPAISASVATPLAFSVPAGFPAPDLPDDNPLTVEGVALGDALFNDRRLSGNGTQSCADCHSPARAFSDGVALSRGADGSVGNRNAMPLFNLAWARAFAWDGSKPHIRDQARAALTNPVEMHGDPARVVATLTADAAMRKKFRAAFGSEEVTLDRVTLALEQRLLTNVSADSRFDRAMKGGAALTEEEKEGFALFLTEYDPARGRRGADCFHCHGGPLFTDYDFKNDGLDGSHAEKARSLVTGRSGDVGKFKTPSLRNIAVTGPYMHDGRFATLEDVVAHYDHGVQRSATLDPNLAKHPVDGMKLSSSEQKALVAFLKALTDPRWQQPEKLKN